MSAMKSRQLAAFTLVEMLVSTAVLALVVVLAGQMTAATLTTVTHSARTLDTSESVRAATMKLRDELSSVVVSERRERYLNLRVVEDDQRVAVFFTAPHAATTDLTRMGFITHVVYVWDRAGRTLGRAEYHSSREIEAVRTTASDATSGDAMANLERLRRITPAYQGGEPYAWTAQSFWNERLQAAQRNPLLTGVADMQVECFKTSALESEEPARNKWERSSRLPAALRISLVVQSKRNSSTDVGRRYVTIIPLPGAEAAP